jgi:hypothetical protein
MFLDHYDNKQMTIKSDIAMLQAKAVKQANCNSRNSSMEHVLARHALTFKYEFSLPIPANVIASMTICMHGCIVSFPLATNTLASAVTA